MLGTVAELEQTKDASNQDARARGVIITGARFRWPNAQVPFQINAALPNQQRVQDAITHWEARTPIRFTERTAANASQFPNFIEFSDAGGCWSMLGMQGNGMQTTSLGTGCSTGNAIHEIGHAVGLWHEQSREDRNTFVTINVANIEPGMESQFDQHIVAGDDVGGYDYGSIMHYPRTAFSKNGQETITPMQARAQIGQRTALSAVPADGPRKFEPGRIVGPEPARRFCSRHQPRGVPQVFQRSLGTVAHRLRVLGRCHSR